jgi:cytidine deaminase
MTRRNAELIRAARTTCGVFDLGHDFTAGAVGAALLTDAGNMYTGICLELGCGLGFCAEVSAIADMLKHRETRIVAVVAVSAHRIVPPCGRCRETIAQVDPRNMDCTVILAEDVVVPLGELLPDHWLDDR